MATIIRKIDIPARIADLPANKREELQETLRPLSAKQKELANLSPGVAVTTQALLQDNTVEIHYQVSQARDLYSVIADKLPSKSTLMDWAEQLCEIFAAAYPTGQPPKLRHGGLFGQNLIVDQDNRLVVLDFGVAEIYADLLGVLDTSDESWLNQVAPGVAPEFWNSPNRFGQLSDIFSVGVLLYELATGQHPYGAIRNDPDDCKYQILVEIPVPPIKRNPSLDERISRVIYKAIRSETDARYQNFGDLLQDLKDCRKTPRQTTPEKPPQPQEPPEPQAATLKEGQEDRPVYKPDEDEEGARRKYLEEQAQLKLERKDDDQRKQEQDSQREVDREKRKQQIQQTKSVLKKHAVAIVSTLVVIAIVISAGSLFFIRHNHSRTIGDALTNMSRQAGEAFSAKNGQKAAQALSITEPSRRLRNAIVDLHKVAPGSEFEFADTEFEDLTCTHGQTLLRVGEQEISLAVRLDSEPGKIILDLGDEVLADAVIKIVNKLALAQLGKKAESLITQIHGVFDTQPSMTDAEAGIAKLLQTSQPSQPLSTDIALLGYLAYRADLTRIQLGSFEPVPGEDAVQAQATLLDTDRQEVLPEDVQVLFWYSCKESASGCTLSRVTMNPQNEPAFHKKWCIDITIKNICEAFKNRSSGELAKLIPDDREEDMSKVLDWAQHCQSASLVFGSVNLSSATVQARVKYTPGILNQDEFETGLLGFAFDSRNEWRVKSGAANQWPTTQPPALVLQRQGEKLLADFRKAWQERNSAQYLALFPGSGLSVDAIAEMFAKMDRDQVKFEITTLEEQEADDHLHIQVKPDITDSKLAQEYEQKKLGFKLRDGELRWDRLSDPLWDFAGLNYRSFIRKIGKSNWNTISTVAQSFNSSGLSGMSAEERERINLWLQAIQAAKAKFQPASDTYVLGLPEKVTLNISENRSLPFHLVHISGTPPTLLYIMEREVQIDDVKDQWQQADMPWKMWEHTDKPPAGQVVGLTLKQAQDFAAQYKCQLPSKQEWLEAARLLGESPEQQKSDLGFYGGVWEFCRDSSPDGKPTIIGGCWLDYELLNAGVPLPQDRAEALEDRPELFGTIGFRICLHTNVPSKIVVSQIDSQEPASQSTP